MSETPRENPLLQPIRDTFLVKRNEKTGLVTRSWLLVLLRILDGIRESDRALVEDDLYTYDFALTNSRASAIPKLLAKYSMPTELGMSNEGVTTRGAPGLRFFRAIAGGGVIASLPSEDREALLLEAIDLLREELIKTLACKPVKLDAHLFAQSSLFVPALLVAVENRSNGRVEQALVGAKLQLRFPNLVIPDNPGFAGDAQTGRDCDFEANNLRVLVSVSPKPSHFDSAKRLADQGRTVVLAVSTKALSSAQKRIRDDGYEFKVRVKSVTEYVTDNMVEIASDKGISEKEMCMKLVAEYNRRVVFDRDSSLQVVVPE